MKVLPFKKEFKSKKHEVFKYTKSVNEIEVIDAEIVKANTLQTSK